MKPHRVRPRHPQLEDEGRTAHATNRAERPVALVDPNEEPSPIASSGEGSANDTMEATAAYSLIDAEGNVLEVDNLEKLRGAFEQLFADRCLSADQIVGLWESNDLARQQLTDAFGTGILEDTHRRQTTAAQHRKPAAHLVETKQKSPRPKRLKIASSSPTPEADLSLKINATWSDEKLLHCYQARLLALKLGRANALTFVDFRLSNGAIEDRLRATLPQLMGPIDEIYA